jgi:hypothetical protein
MTRYLTIGAALVGLALSSCSGDDEGASTTPTRPNEVETPSGGAAPPSGPGQLPPEVLECMAEQGFEVRSSADIHSAPPQVLQACFGSIH